MDPEQLIGHHTALLTGGLQPEHITHVPTVLNGNRANGRASAYIEDHQRDIDIPDQAVGQIHTTPKSRFCSIHSCPSLNSSCRPMM